MHYIIITYFLLSFFLLFSCAIISYKLKLVDLPNERKMHTNATVYTGGVAISVAFVFSILLFPISSNNLNLIVSMAFLICIIGLIDDKYDLNVGSKLSLQIIPIFYLIIIQNLSLEHLGDYYYFNLKLGSFVIPFTLLCVLFLINAFNYFDGLDGTLSFTSMSVLVILYFMIPDQEFKFFLIIIIIPLFLFLFFNFSLFKLPKMFLGDSGSLLLGFIISFILIYLASQNIIHPILLAWSIVIFVYEFLSINLIRLKNNQNPFKAGRDHLHHLLFKKTKSVFFTNFLITALNIGFFIIGYLSFSIISPLASLILFLLMFIIFLLVRYVYATKNMVLTF